MQSISNNNDGTNTLYMFPPSCHVRLVWHVSHGQHHNGVWALKVLHLKKDGHYHHGAKITIILAIELGDPVLPLNAPGSVESP
jgi:hypothetical protein